jgi:hypothetical protein
MNISNVCVCIEGLRIAAAGNPQAGRKLMKHCTVQDLRDAAAILKNQELLADNIIEIGKRHFQPRDNDNLRKILRRAAKAGDADAELIIESGLLDEVVF